MATAAAWLAILLALGTPDHPKALSPTTARTQIEPLARARYGNDGWKCLDRLVARESRWNPLAKSSSSSARGLFQLLRMPKGVSVIKQWGRGSRYLDARYGDPSGRTLAPCNALKHSDQHGWY